VKCNIRQQFERVTFDASGDEEKSVIILLANVARHQTQVLIKHLLGLVLHVQIAHEDVTTIHTHLHNQKCIIQ